MLMAVEVELGLLVAKQSRKGFFPLFFFVDIFGAAGQITAFSISFL